MSARALCQAWLAGSLAILFGVFLPWYHLTAPFFGTVTRSGAETQGILLPILGLTTATCAVLYLVGLGRPSTAWLGAAAAAVAALLAVGGLVSVSRALAQFRGLAGPPDRFVQALSTLTTAGYEPGILLCLIGTVVAAVAPVVLIVRKG
jgi:hypothetical protein